ncbi:hypothetical protein ACJX0J_020806, partial [Zea mays]
MMCQQICHMSILFKAQFYLNYIPSKSLKNHALYLLIAEVPPKKSLINFSIQDKSHLIKARTRELHIFTSVLLFHDPSRNRALKKKTGVPLIFLIFLSSNLIQNNMIAELHKEGPANYRNFYFILDVS